MLYLITLFLLNLNVFKEAIIEYNKEKNNHFLITKNNPEIVYRIKKYNLYDVKKGLNGKPLPVRLIINPGYYFWRDKVYDLRIEGIYRFFKYDKTQEQRIVYKNNLYDLLSSLSLIHTHGIGDDHLNINELTQKALKNKLVLTCGYISRWINNILKSLKIKSRLVATLTLDKWNNYDNGHTMIEIYDRNLKKWILFDIDNNSYFINQQRKEPLSLIEFSKYVKSKHYNLEPLAYDISYANNMNSFYNEKVFFDKKNWYRRVVQVIMIFDEEYGKYFHFDLKNKKRIQSYSNNYTYINPIKFMKKFYNSKVH